MLDQDDKTYFDLSGALMYDACIGGCGTVQEDIPTHQFVMNNQVILNLNQSILDNMDKVASTCGLNDVSFKIRMLASTQYRQIGVGANYHSLVHRKIPPISSSRPPTY